MADSTYSYKQKIGLLRSLRQITDHDQTAIKLFPVHLVSNAFADRKVADAEYF